MAMGRVGDLPISSFLIKETAIQQSGVMQCSWFCSRDPVLMIKKPSTMQDCPGSPTAYWEWLFSVLFSPANPEPSPFHLTAFQTASAAHQRCVVWALKQARDTCFNIIEVQNSQGYCFVHLQGIQSCIVVDQCPISTADWPI